MQTTTVDTTADTTADTPVSLAATIDVVDRLLGPTGRGPVIAVAEAPLRGRNTSHLMTLEGGERVFVKRLDGQPHPDQRLGRCRAFETFRGTDPHHAPRSPRMIAADSATQVMVFALAPGRNAAHLLIDETLPEDFTAQMGTLLADLHAGMAPHASTAAPQSPPVSLLTDGLAYAGFHRMTLAERGLWAALQSDQDLLHAITTLHHQEQQHLTTPIHGDLRLDQIHVAEHLWILDWEEFGHGDPARDIGTFTGEWIYRGVLDTVTTRRGATEPAYAFDHDTVTARLTERIQAILPEVRQFWHTYTTRHGVTDPDLAARAAAFTGWHLIDRTMVRSMQVSRLPGIERAAAGIGRRALLDPRTYAPVLGLGA